MFERPKVGERALLVHVDLQNESEREDLSEFRDLAISAGALPLEIVTSARRTPEAKYFIGTGKAAEIRDLVQSESIDLVLVNHGLTPAQERNLEQLIQCRVLDRTGLILDIFAQRARSHEGKLQVELAQLRHLSTRLVRGWTHLERQKGGIGLRGPGETQLETDRRLLGARIKQLNSRLDKVRKQREQSRKGRQRAELPTVSLVGYTNAGKSTLFNRLSEQEAVYAADQLFATLDPTLRRIELQDGLAIVLADTVGFIRHLPHDLVEAFRSTLQETEEADLLLHVIDAGDEERREKITQVDEVLASIGATDVPQIEVYNKIDTVEGMGAQRIDGVEGERIRVYCSAETGEGIDELLQALVDTFRPSQQRVSLHLPPQAGRLRAKLHQIGKVFQEQHDETGQLQIDVEMAAEEWDRLKADSDFFRYLDPYELGTVKQHEWE